MRAFSFMNSNRTAPTRLNATCCALALAIAAVSLPTWATDASDTGNPGANGASGIIGKKGGNGAGAQTNLVTVDYFNTATATAGKGGNGGNSFPLLPGANGGNGGTAKAALQSGGQQYNYDHDVVSSSVNASGGDGGNGGSGLLPGNGGTGGAAHATGADTGGVVPEDFSAPAVLVDVNAAAGNGGSGRNGGAGGASTAAASLSGSPASPGSVDATARGGAGGNALLSAGKGGAATATTVYNNGGFPSDDFAGATAIGGNGGTSTTGLNGNGGNASATASGTHSARDLELTIEAHATGGNSGTNGNLRGNGGDAYASASGHAENVAAATPSAVAQGGNGVVRGGNAVANADATSDFMFASATAAASGGAGQHAGAAVATATSTVPFLSNGVTASANYAGDFVRNVTAFGGSFSLDNPVTTTLYAQARAGDTSGLLPLATAKPSETNGFVTAVAPTQAEAAATLAGNPTIASAFAGGSVWGIGAIGNATGADSFGAGSSFTFDISDIANPQHLLLGLFDSNLPSDSTGDFHFSISGEGTTLFDRDFTGADFLTYFDDRVFDLGNWASLVGADGLLDLDVSFSGFAPEIQFAVGQKASAVPEPTTLALAVAGLFGIFIARRRGRAQTTR
ncbi:MAG: hypothetical protein JWM78_2055 [Verrucomicrobiaceae bacterium]|nr:hypothetical protein [Verrucomicrobiaceae bacterium]